MNSFPKKKKASVFDSDGLFRMLVSLLSANLAAPLRNLLRTRWIYPTFRTEGPFLL